MDGDAFAENVDKPQPKCFSSKPKLITKTRARKEKRGKHIYREIDAESLITM